VKQSLIPMALVPFASFALTVLLGAVALAQGALTAPVAARKDHVQVYHGQSFSDPYYWLREKDAPQVVSYLEAENAYTQTATASLQPFTEALYAEILGRIKQTDLGVPTRIGHYYYYSRTVEGLQYPVRCRKPVASDGTFRADAVEQVLLDQNEMAKGKAFLSIQAFSASDDDSRLLYTTDETGFRQYKLFVKDLASGAIQGPLAERVTSATWAADSQTLFYVTEDPTTKRSDTLWRVKLGAPAEKVYEEKDELFETSIGRTKDRRFLVSGSDSTDTWEQRILAADKPQGTFRVVLPRAKGHKYEIEHRDGQLYIRTNKDAKNFRLVSAPLDNPSPAHWTTIVPHRTDLLLDGVEVFRDFLVVQEKQAGLNRLRIRRFGSDRWSGVTFPEPVYAAFATGTPEFTSRLLRYNYQSLTTPSSIYDHDMETGQSVLLKRQEVLGKYDPTRYASERLWATARDGVKVPISIVYAKDRPRNGRSPLLLFGYGAYGIGMSAAFDVSRLSLLDRGVAFAIAHVRGGDEMGEAWHDDGMLMKKKNTFYDFIDCAELLIKDGWTAKDGLLIEGGSAGGLLMGAVVNERPDLFKAVHALVPFVDVINTMMDASLPLTVPEYLEWGNPNEKAAFDYMLSYSPYDRLERKAYPALLVTTSYNDSQVMYWEPAKFVAKLRTLKTDSNPLLLKIKMQPAGHGGASGRYDALRDRAFELAWMLSQVGITR